jgi:VanZ family protein
MLFVGASLVALGVTPLQSAGVLRHPAWCELSAPLPQWWTGINNPRHIVSYGILCLIGATAFSGRRLAKAVAATLMISVLVEMEQAVLLAGHCRLRDLLPNTLAVCLCGLIWSGWCQIAHARGRERREKA